MSGKPNVTVRKLTDYKPNPRNHNKGSERGSGMIEHSFRTFGAGRSLLADKNGVLIAGNQSQEGALNAGIERVIEVETTGNDIVVVKRTDLDLEQDERAVLLSYADNRTHEVSFELDIEQVEADVERGIDLSGLWTEAELAQILPTEDPAPDAGAQIDRAAELLTKWQVERGQLWIIPSKSGKGEHRLLCGDSTSADDVARLMNGELARLVVTDPPYGVDYADKNKFLNAVARGNHIQTPIANDHGNKSDIQDMWRQAFERMSAVMSPGAVVYCFMPQGGDQMMMMMMMMGAGIEPRHELIWLKNNHVLGRVDYAYKHEPILYAWKGSGHKFYGGFQTSVIECNKPQKSDLHPTMKPVELIERLVNNSSVSGENVYDPFGGSGTTMVACEQLARQCRMMEIEPKYCAVILERMAAMGLEPILSSHNLS